VSAGVERLAKELEEISDEAIASIVALTLAAVGVPVADAKELAVRMPAEIRAFAIKASEQ
jgi:hypothetical protein